MYRDSKLIMNRPFSNIGMPYYRETLLSSWPSHMIFEVGGPPIKIDPAILNNLTRTEFGGYAPNPRKTRRNQAEDARAAEKAIAALEGPKFLSERAKDGENEDAGRRMSEILDQLTTSTLDGSLKIDVPVMYRNVEIKYSKFGVEDFDFEYVAFIRHATSKLTPCQVLQQDKVLGSGNTHCQFLREPFASAFEIYTMYTKSGASSYGNVLPV